MRNDLDAPQNAAGQGFLRQQTHVRPIDVDGNPKLSPRQKQMFAETLLAPLSSACRPSAKEACHDALCFP